MSGKFRPARKVARRSYCLEPLPGEIEMAVKMRPTCTWTKRPRGALLHLDTEDFILTVEHRWEPCPWDKNIQILPMSNITNKYQLKNFLLVVLPAGRQGLFDDWKLDILVLRAGRAWNTTLRNEEI